MLHAIHISRTMPTNTNFLPCSVAVTGTCFSLSWTKVEPANCNKMSSGLVKLGHGGGLGGHGGGFASASGKQMLRGVASLQVGKRREMDSLLSCCIMMDGARGVGAIVGSLVQDDGNTTGWIKYKP